jgi:putative glutamine amidotransferase
MGCKSASRKPVIGITVDVVEEYFRIKSHYPAAVIKAGAVPILLPCSVDPSSVIGIIDGLLISGGGDIDPSYYLNPVQGSGYEVHRGTGRNGVGKRGGNGQYEIVPRERTDFEIAILAAIMELRKPVLGVCYGMQLINVALGGGLYQDIVSELGTTIDHVKGNHRIFGKGSPIEGEFVVKSSHHQAVKQLGRGLLGVACSDDGLVEAVRLRDYPFLVGVQWHPERDDGDLSRRLFRSFVETAHA